MVQYTDSCTCGQKFDGGNCAHYLTNWMIKNNVISPNPSGCYCCDDGRPIRAADVRNFIFPKLGKKHTSQPLSGNCYIYCIRNSDGQGHVYYGRYGNCVAGTRDGFYGADEYEYYY